MKRKLISIVCTIAMLMSMISSFCIVNAEAAVGMALALDETKSTDTLKVVDVSYTGMTSIASVQFTLPVDVEKIESISLEWDASLVAAMKTSNIGEDGVTGLPTGEITDAISALALSFMGDVTVPNGKFVTISIQLKEALAEDMVLQLQDLVLQGDGADAPAANVEAGSLTIAAPVVEPTATPTPTPKPTTAPIVVEKGMNLTLDEANSTDTTKVIKVSYAGFTSVASVQFALPVDVEKISNITLEWDASLATAMKTSNIGEDGVSGLPTGEITDAISALALSFMGDVTVPNGEFLTITIELKEALTEEMVLQLGDLVLQGDGADAPATDIAGGNLVLAAPVVEPTDPPVEPTPTATPDGGDTTPAPTATPEAADPRPTAMPTATPEVTPDPTATPAPTTEPIVVEKGMNLTLDEANSTDTTKVIKVSYAGFTSVASVQFALPVDVEKISNITLEWDASLATAMKTSNIGEDGVSGLPTGEITDAISALALSFMGDVTVPNGEFLTITIELKEALTEEMVLQLGDLVLQGDGADAPATDITGGNLVLAPAAEPTTPPVEPTATPVPTEEPDAVKEAALKDLVDPELATDDAYVTIETDGVYGTDYVAKDADGNALTEAEFFNKIWGYDGSVKDAINNITLVIYTDGTEITANLNAGGVKVDSGSTKEEDEPIVPDTKDPSIAWSDSDLKITITKGESKSVSVKVKNIDVDYTIVSEVVDGEDNVTTTDKKSSVSIKGTKVGTADVVVRAIDEDGNVIAESEELAVTVKKASSGSSSSGSSSSGGGSVGTIAGGVVNSTTGGNIYNPGIITTVNFTDLGEAAWAADAIKYLAERGIVNGRTATTFAPNADITRAEFAKLVMTVYGISPSAGAFTASTYSDVATNAWYFDYIESASYLGIVTGYPDGTFRPDALVSRQEMALMMYRAANFMRTELPATKTATAWADADQIGDWAAEAVTALNVAGIMNGTSATTFEPTASATRAQAAQMIYNLYQVAQ